MQLNEPDLPPMQGLSGLGVIDPLTAGTVLGGGVLALANTFFGGAAASDQAKAAAKARSAELKAAQAALAAQTQMQQMALADAQLREAQSRRSMIVVLGVGGVALLTLVVLAKKLRR